MGVVVTGIAGMVETAGQTIGLLETYLTTIARVKKGPYPPALDEADLQKVLCKIRRDHVGRAKAMKQGVMADLLRFDDVGTSGHPRSDNSIYMTKLVEELRRRGYPICGDQSGYFWPECYADCVPTIIHKLKCALTYLRRALDMARAADYYFQYEA